MYLFNNFVLQIHNLSPDQLKMRKIIYLNIATDKLGKPPYDPSKFHSKVTGRGPLTNPDWAATHKPLMCCYKLIQVKFSVFGLQSIVEKTIEQVILNNY